MSDPRDGPKANASSPDEKDAMEQSGESGESDSEMSEEDPDRPDPSASPPRAKKQEQQERRHVVDNESGVALLLETRRGRRPRRGRNTTVRAWRFGNLVWEYKIRGRVEHTAVAEGFVAFATRAALHLLSTVGGYLLFPPMDGDSVLQVGTCDQSVSQCEGFCGFCA